MLENNYQKVLNTIAAAARRAGRDPDEVRLIAVSKAVGPATVRQAMALGLKDFGENRIQEAAPKIATLSGVHWHFIGHLQSNKARDALQGYHLIHSLDRLSLARALQRCAESGKTSADVLVQVNVSGEKSKHGLPPEDLPSFLDSLLVFDRIRVRGLMTMAPWTACPEEARPLFARLRSLRDENATPQRPLTELSMGMSGDYDVAVEEGATMVRIGGALFTTSA